MYSLDISGSENTNPPLHSNVLSSSLERWSLPLNFWAKYRSKIECSSNIEVLTNFTCTKINFENTNDHVSSISVSNIKGIQKKIHSKFYVLACGGLETTRLLLDSNDVHEKGIGNKSGLLGKFYMGHISGKISSIKFTKDIDKVSYGFEKDNDGIYCKKRFTLSESEQNKSKLLNFSASSKYLSGSRFKNSSPIAPSKTALYFSAASLYPYASPP